MVMKQCLFILGHETMSLYILMQFFIFKYIFHQLKCLLWYVLWIPTKFHQSIFELRNLTQSKIKNLFTIYSPTYTFIRLSCIYVYCVEVGWIPNTTVIWMWFTVLKMPLHNKKLYLTTHHIPVRGQQMAWRMILYINGLVQDRSISIANALEILQSCTEATMWCSRFTLACYVLKKTYLL